ncbi:phosphoenolpyruvate synthase [Candidatus Parvarchaeota archaeon]|nr:phosphoenolpyruvate synthase [Candidatus Parvarchaeota archaeon]
MMESKEKLVLWFKDIKKEDVPLIGGKSANLGEMFNYVEVPIPPGFSTTSYAFNTFLDSNNLRDTIEAAVKNINVEDEAELKKASSVIKTAIMRASFPQSFISEILSNYHKLVKESNAEFVAVRSSATAEDLPDASFAGQQDTYLNVHGDDELAEKVKECYASLFNERAIYYRAKNSIDTKTVALAVVVQKQVFSVESGVMFTLDVSNGDQSVIVIEASYGLGEYIVGGIVTPDLFYIDKKTMQIKRKVIENKDRKLVRLKEGGTKDIKLSDEEAKKQCLMDSEVLELAGYGMKIEQHYKRPMDIEWAKDEDGKIYIVQARPETVWSNKDKIKTVEKKEGIILSGLPASPGFVSGPAHVILDVKDIDEFRSGEILITVMTSPDWVPAMKKAKAIVTDEGGITSHAAIVSRELGVPCIVGTGGRGKKATEVVKTNDVITVDSKNGLVYSGEIKAEENEQKSSAGQNIVNEGMIITGTKILVNLGEPDLAEKTAKLHADGVGLMREEFLWANIGKHPMYLIKQGKSDLLVDTLAEGMRKVCAAFNPRPVILRFSDFKTDEYAHLEGGEEFEPKESSPLLGWRGSSRYYDPKYKDAFVLELKAVKKVRDEFRLKNLHVMIPFTRTVDELKKVLEILKENGLERNEDFKIFLMAEIPSNIILADKFNRYIDGYSIGSNDLTMLVLGADRNNDTLSSIYDERNLAVLRMIRYLIKVAHRDGKTVSICGQAPSEYDEIVDFLVRSDIDDISVNPDAVEHVRELTASIEKRVELEKNLGQKNERAKDWEFPVL